MCDVAPCVYESFFLCDFKVVLESGALSSFKVLPYLRPVKVYAVTRG